MNRWIKTIPVLFLMMAPFWLKAQQASRNQVVPQVKSTPTPQPISPPQAQPLAKPTVPSRPIVSSRFTVPRTVRPSTPIDQYNENRQVQIDVSQPSGAWDSQPSPSQVQIEFVPQNLNATADMGLSISPATSNDSYPSVTSQIHHQHHPYQPGYVRKKLQKLGVAHIPYPLTNRAQLLDDDRAHSVIRVPHKGPDHQPLAATPISPRDYNDELVRGPMSLIDQDSWRKAINQLNLTENKPKHYYWHKDKGFNYCHYLDESGNQWYGWYSGNSYFWTRCYGDLWWRYDSEFNRWCFWYDGWWWWQDPYHVGDLYFYNGDQYIACNSANDNMLVTTAITPNPVTFASPDGTRQVKIFGVGQDAFLYDTAVPQSFQPVYLASKVQMVEFEDPGDGGPNEIYVTLSDGTVNYFDLQGTPLETTAMDNVAVPSSDSGIVNPPAGNP
jgi:hypothetical protein